MHDVSAERTTFAFRPDAKPVLRVQPGEAVRFSTSPHPSERLFAAGDDWLGAIDLDAINAVSGPVFIEGVEPGDAVTVEILDVALGDWGWCIAMPGFGLLGDVMADVGAGAMLRRVPLVDGRCRLSDRLSVPIRPMIGCLGLAPATGQSSTLFPPMPWGGNYDVRQSEPGNTWLFPAQVPGGLFSLGDLHAAMGLHEATYVSIEGPGSATVRLGVRRGLTLTTPRIESPEKLYTIGLHSGGEIGTSGDFHRARLQATKLMFEMLTKEHGLTAEEAYLLVSAAVDLEFGGPAGAVVLAAVPRSLLP